MKKLFLPLLALVLLLCACGPEEPAEAVQPEGSSAITFTDALDREITVDSPKRVAVLIGSFADIWRLAGGEASIVAAANDSWTEFGLALDESVVNLGSAKEPNLELILSSEPDLVIASANTAADLELRDSLERAGVNTAFFSVSTFDDYLDVLKLCTEITGQPERYEQYGTAVAASVEAARAVADGSAPTALYVRASASGVKVKNSEDSVLGEMLRDLGAVNIADSDKTLLESLSMEAIILDDPEYIFVVLQGADEDAVRKVFDDTLASDPAWASLSAVKEGRVYFMETRLFNLKPNALWGDAYEKLAALLYPAE